MTAAVHTATALDERTDDFGAIYEENYQLLVRTAVKHYHISELDAEALAHEVFLAYFLKAHEVINSRAWLISAICNATKYFLRKRARHVSLPSESGEIPDPSLERVNDALPDRLAAREAFECVTAKCQIALRLRYLEGYSVPEVAAELNTSPKYAQKLISRCLRQAKNRYRKRGEP
ncbi:MAG TPA: sigma-70 family RNA polymerase sigma factor [Thermoanaerobaculia bacterium]|nr:sigma-70 family RNA polymerase sigma factor [Thermoanaerobaculia bacterium]